MHVSSSKKRCQFYTLGFTAAQSITALTEFDIADLNFRNLDNDQPGFSVGAISNNLSENENLASFSVVLDIKPNDNVFFDITSNDGSEVAVEAGF